MNLHIAVVDDEASVRKSIARLLGLAGFEPRVYGSGLQFLDACGVEPPACALIDVQMPGLTGTEVCERVVESGIGIPLIMMSANDDPEVRAMCLAIGAACFLPRTDPSTKATCTGRKSPPCSARAECRRRQPRRGRFYADGSAFSKLRCARRCISSGATSSTCVEIVHMCPKGSLSVPDRSP
jgi:CheY-like chemotaxis protein